MRVTIGLFCWRNFRYVTKPWIQHSGNSVTWSHVYGLEGFGLGISQKGWCGGFVVACLFAPLVFVHSPIYILACM